MTKLKKLIQLSEPNFNLNSTFLYQIKSNNWAIGKIEFLNFKLPNFFKFKIDFETYSAFEIFVKLGYYICQISNFFFKFHCLNLHNQKVKVSKWLQFCIVSECLTI